MSITITPGISPIGLPRMGISITSSNGSTITAVSVVRNEMGAQAPVRFQPTAGPSPRVTNDYEPTWDTTVTYTATVTSGAGTETFTSGAAQLTSTVPWAIHPTAPALSFRLDQATTLAAGIRTLSNVSRDATDTAHTVLGSPYRVYTTTGPRSAATMSIELTTVTSLEARTVRAALNDLTPLLFQVPASAGWDFENGYYRVGQTDEARLIQYGAEQARIFTLPIERVEYPAGTQQQERTWANVLTGFSTWNAVRAAYSTWTNVLTDTRG